MEHPAVRQSVLQKNAEINAGAYDVNTKAPSKSAEYTPGGIGSSGISTIIPDRIQIGGAPRYSIRMVGRAIRAGHQIPVPKLVNVGTQTPIELRNVFMQYEIDNFFGVPVYGARWSIDYLLPEAPGLVAVIPDQRHLT